MTTAISFSLAILHAPWQPGRQTALAEMLRDLREEDPPCRIFDERKRDSVPWAKFKTVLADAQWDWALNHTSATHHIFLTDDLNIAPRFWAIARAMIEARPSQIIGLLSNHPQGPTLTTSGLRWYRCNSWVVGPAYVLPRVALAPFLDWYRQRPDDETPNDGRRWFNDDSALNHWNTHFGPGESWHPLPTPIEHRYDLPSTVGHGDRYSRERVSWREVRRVVASGDGGTFHWESEPAIWDIDQLATPEFWLQGESPMLSVGGG